MTCCAVVAPVPISCTQWRIRTFPSGIEFQRQSAGIRARAVILLYLRETDAVQLAGVGPVEVGLGFLTVDPQRMLCCEVEHFNIVQFSQRLGSLSVLKTGLQRIAAAQFDLIHTQFDGEFIDHQLRNTHCLEGTIAAHRPCLDRRRCKRDGRNVGFREIIDRLCGSRAHLRDREGKVCAAAAIEVVEHLQDFEQAALTVSHDGHVHFDGVTFYAELELLVAVVGQPHRQAVPVEACRECVERKDGMIFGTVPDGSAREQLDRLDRESLVALDHQRRNAGDLIRRLCAHDQVQRTRPGIIPCIAVVRLQRARINRLRKAVSFQYQLAFIRACRFDALFDVHGSIHAAQHRLIGFACDRKRITYAASTPLLQHDGGGYEHPCRGFRRPYRVVAIESTPDDGILHRRIDG